MKTLKHLVNGIENVINQYSGLYTIKIVNDKQCVIEIVGNYLNIVNSCNMENFLASEFIVIDTEYCENLITITYYYDSLTKALITYYESTDDIFITILLPKKINGIVKIDNFNIKFIEYDTENHILIANNKLFVSKGSNLFDFSGDNTIERFLIEHFIRFMKAGYYLNHIKKMDRMIYDCGKSLHLYFKKGSSHMVITISLDFISKDKYSISNYFFSIWKGEYN